MIQESKVLTDLIKHYLIYKISQASDCIRTALVADILAFLESLQKSSLLHAIDQFFFTEDAKNFLVNFDLGNYENLVEALTSIQKNRLQLKYWIAYPSCNQIVRRKEKQLNFVLWDTYLLKDFVLTFLLPAIKYVRLFTQDQLLLLVDKQFAALYSSKMMAELTSSEIART